MTFWVYVLVNPQKDIYIGQTRQLEIRLAQHNDPECRGTLHTKRRPGPWRLVHQEQFDTRGDAIRRERELKGSRGRAWIRQQLEIGC
jgi:putative endonuclease